MICAGLVVTAIWIVGGREPPTVTIRQPIAVTEERRIALKPSSDAAIDDREPVVSSLLNVPQPMRYGDYIWDDKGIAPGNAWVRVDLDAQIISVFRAGHEIGTAVILYGADKKPTPAGRFPVLAKLKNHQSSLYEAAMPYTLRLTKDGIAIHGSDVRHGLATNGCIGIPKDFAAKLFDEMRVGSNVVILSGGQSERPPDSFRVSRSE